MPPKRPPAPCWSGHELRAPGRGRAILGRCAVILVSAQAFPPRLGGIENLMAGFAAHATGAGHRVRVLADGGLRARAADRAAPPAYGVDRFWGPRPLRRRAKAFRIRRLVAAGGVRALYADSWKSLEALPGAGLDLPIVAWAHGNEYADAAKAGRIRRALGRAGALICISRDTHGRLAAMLPPGLRVAIVPPPIAPPAAPAEADRRWAEGLWAGASPRLVALARLTEFKGIDAAIAAVAALKARFPALRYVVAGAGHDLARLQGIARKAGVAERVLFAGRVEGGRKSALLHSADLFLVPGREVGGQREGSGMVYSEAALAGLPAICGNKGGVVEKVVDGETGLIVDGERPAEIAAALARLLDDTALAAAMGERARTAGARALWPRRIDEILALAGL